jgi:xylulokinase
VNYILATDLGTGGPKVALCTVLGDVVAHGQARNAVTLLAGGGAEQDPEEWWRTITATARDVIASSGVRPDDVVAVALTSQWMGTVAVDAEGRHLGPAIIWLDSRGARYSEEIAGGGLRVPGTGYNAVKLQRWVRLTGGAPTLTGKDPVGHILFLQKERPDVYRSAFKFLEPMDYLTSRLTGRMVASFGSVTGYWCTDNRDISRIRYDDALIRATGLPREKLPELVPTNSIVGKLTAKAAAELGLPASIDVVAPMPDTASAGIGAGAVRDFDAHLYVGTSSWLSCHVPFKKTDIGNNIASLPSGIPERYWVATEQDAAGKCLSWLVDSVLYPDDALGSGPPPKDVFARLDAMAESAAPGSAGTLFLPWLNGEKTPVDDHHVRGGFVNVSLTTDRAALVRAVLEGVALNTRWMMNAAEEFVRPHRRGGFPEIRFVGGGANSAVWCRIFADVLQRRIVQVKDPVLANARGAALAASVALGRLSWDDVPARVPVANIFDPDASRKPLYDAAFDAFLEAYEGVKGLRRTSGGVKA